MTEHPSLDTPGGLIRAARKSQGVSLSEMSERTKIPPQVIDAIERDEYHKVSGALYIKSFLRTCAVEMGLEPDEILDLYGSFSGEIRPQVGGAETVWSEPEVKISRIGLPWRLISIVGGGLVVVGAVALLLVRGFDSDSSTKESELPATEQTTTTRAINEGLLEDGSEVKPETAAKSDYPDTLARAWANGVENNEPALSVPPAVENASESEPAEVRNTAAMPIPLVGGTHLVFAGGHKQRVVLRVVCERPLGIEVKRDAGQVFEKAIWPPAGTAVVPLPPTGIVPGRVYGIAGGFAVYWGAGDHLSLRLDRTDGVEVTLNGKTKNIQNLRPGGELLLDAHGE